jgi:hypothetical protein
MARNMALVVSRFMQACSIDYRHSRMLWFFLGISHLFLGRVQELELRREWFGMPCGTVLSLLYRLGKTVDMPEQHKIVLDICQSRKIVRSTLTTTSQAQSGCSAS